MGIKPCHKVHSDWTWLNNVSTSETLAKGEDYPGSLARRCLRTRSGEIFTASTAINNAKAPFRLTLRFKNGRRTIQKQIGIVEGETRFQALKAGWQKTRSENFIEQFGWSWVSE